MVNYGVRMKKYVLSFRRRAKVTSHLIIWIRKFKKLLQRKWITTLHCSPRRPQPRSHETTPRDHHQLVVLLDVLLCAPIFFS